MFSFFFVFLVYYFTLDLVEMAAHPYHTILSMLNEDDQKVFLETGFVNLKTASVQLLHAIGVALQYMQEGQIVRFLKENILPTSLPDPRDDENDNELRPQKSFVYSSKYNCLLPGVVYKMFSRTDF